MNILRGDSDQQSLPFLPLPVSDDQSAERNIVRRMNASRLSAGNFIQVEVIVSDLIQFQMAIAKSISFEELACLVEAEYSFKTGEIVTCCILCSDDWIPFHLDWIVGSHLVYGATIRVFSYTIANRTEFGLSRLNPIVVSDQDFADTLSQITNDEELEKKYYEFMIKSFSLENLFFFLDLHASKKKLFSMEIYRVYLTIVYIMPNSPLSINLDSEIKRNIIQSCTGMKGVDPSIFDDAFHEVSWSLKLVTDSFLKRYSITELSPKFNQNPAFKINLKNTTNIMESLLTDSNVSIGKVTEKSINAFMASVTILDRIAIDRYSILTKVQSRFFTNKKDIDSKSAYFFDSTREKSIDRVTLIDKSSKLRKKFGQQPSQKDLFRQVSRRSSGSSMLVRSDDEDEISEEEYDKKAVMVKRSNRLNSFFGENVAPHLISLSSVSPESKKGDDLTLIRKKWDKLQALLGESIPITSMISQKQIKTDEENPKDLFLIYQETLRALTTAVEDAAQLVDILFTFSQLDLYVEKSVPEPTKNRRVSIEVSMDSLPSKQPSTSEKKIIKLENFFGSDIGVTSLLRQIESQIVSDVESLIEGDITDPEQQKILRSDIEKTRHQIHSKITRLSEHCKIVE